MKSTFSFFKGSLIFTIVCLVLGGFVGGLGGGVTGALQAVVICVILGILEVTLSFDNAVVNAKVLETMDPKWQHRFITWGIAIAVFGMRIVFPIVIVSIVASISPWSALTMALTQPEQYAQALTSASTVIEGFGGAFLFLVFISFFVDHEKDVHWLQVIEQPISKLGLADSVYVLLTLLAMFACAQFVPEAQQFEFIKASIWGVVTWLGVHGLSSFMEEKEQQMLNGAVAKTGLSAFLYLELLDASFSFDGVIGAFALSNNIFIIALGLGIGAMFVRSMTIYLVEKKTLAEFRYLEHGAFYAIGALAVIMLLGPAMHIPEVVTGLIGAAFIGLALYSSILHNRQNKAA